MSHPTFISTLPVTIRLGPSWPRRLAAGLLSIGDRLVQAWTRRAQERAQRRWAKAQRAWLSTLDARTLRDLGLGDWAACDVQRDASLWREVQGRGV